MKGKVSGVDKPLSRIVLGTMVLDTEKMEESFALLDAALKQGINTFDTGAVYGGGMAERCLGAWCEERGNRDRVVILDRGCHHNGDRKRVTPFDLAADIYDALARLRTDYVDIYMLHRDDPAVPVDTIVEMFNEHHAAGRIRAFGVSNWTHERIREAVRYADDHGLVPFSACSPNYGLADQVDDPWGAGCTSLSGADYKAAREWFVETGMPVFAYSSLARGLFSGRISRENFRDTADGACRKAYCHEINFQRLDRATEMAKQKGVTVPQIALAFVLSSPMNVFALVGAATPAEIEQCAAAATIELSQEELAWLEIGTGSKE
ncbi:MAG: aldo/keto reductase [Lentisphaerae bacterium]|nr:aldo/keto reductase [Lentisphaerota bacterium]